MTIEIRFLLAAAAMLGEPGTRIAMHKVLLAAKTRAARIQAEETAEKIYRTMKWDTQLLWQPVTKEVFDHYTSTRH